MKNRVGPGVIHRGLAVTHRAVSLHAGRRGDGHRVACVRRYDRVAAHRDHRSFQSHAAFVRREHPCARLLLAVRIRDRFVRVHSAMPGIARSGLRVHDEAGRLRRHVLLVSS